MNIIMLTINNYLLLKKTDCDILKSNTDIAYQNKPHGIVESFITAGCSQMLQHSKAMYSFSYINWLQLAAEYGGCSL